MELVQTTLFGIEGERRRIRKDSPVVKGLRADGPETEKREVEHGDNENRT